MSEEFNPYRAPESDIVVPQGNGDFRVEGKDLICRTGAVLPPRCVKTNEPVGSERMKTKTFYWTSSWIYLLLLIHLLVLLLAYFIIRKPVTLTFGISPAARSRRIRQHLGFWMVFLGSIAAMYGGIMSDTNWMMFVGLFGIIACVVALLWIGSVLRPVKRLSSGEFAMRGCGPEFLASIEDDIRTARGSAFVPGAL